MRKLRPFRVGWPLSLAALACTVLAACTTPLAQYELLDQPLSCDKANRVVFETMQAMGFTITGVDVATPGHPGMVKGVKELIGAERRTQHGVARVACNATGVDINAGEEGKILGQVDMKRGFLIAYKSVLAMAERREEMKAKIAAGTAPEKWQRKALQVLVDPLRGYAAKIEFHLDMAAANVLPIRVTMNNPTRHRYLLGEGAIKLMRADRRRVPPLSPEEAADRILSARDPQTGTPVTTLGYAAVASRLRGKVFAAERVDPKAKVEGYLYFPLDAYKRAKVVLIEEESGESEGFLVEF